MVISPGTWFIIILAATVLASILFKKLTVAGAVTGGVIATAIYSGTQLAGVIVLAVFFLIGTLTTSWKYDQKVKLGLAENDHGKRDLFQVLANGGAAGVIGLLAFFFPFHSRSLFIILASSLSAAAADTTSSELGSLYGRKFFNIISFSIDQRGENGVVSAEGSLAGLMASTLVAIVAALLRDLGFGSILIIIISGTFGNVADSVAGAVLERKGLTGNNTVNMINTITGALTALIILAAA